MRIANALTSAAGPALLPRPALRPGRIDSTPDAKVTLGPAVRSELPGPVADRLAWLMAGDPALAQAINAQLPAARQATAIDLAAYVASGRPPRVDVSG
jgi:hypothetical protein